MKLFLKRTVVLQDSCSNQQPEVIIAEHQDIEMQSEGVWTAGDDG